MEEVKCLNIMCVIIFMWKVIKEVDGGIFVIGNVFIVLFELICLIKEGEVKFGFVIGLLVGFVLVVEFKEEFVKFDVLFIINIGWKGGSMVMVVVLNVILIFVD